MGPRISPVRRTRSRRPTTIVSVYLDKCMPRRGAKCMVQWAERQVQGQGHTRSRVEAPRVATKGQSRGTQRKCRANARGISAQSHTQSHCGAVQRQRVCGASDVWAHRFSTSVEFEEATDERSTSALREGGGTSPPTKETGARPADKGTQLKEICGASVTWAHILSAVEFEVATARVVDPKTSTICNQRKASVRRDSLGHLTGRPGAAYSNAALQRPISLAARRFSTTLTAQGGNWQRAWSLRLAVSTQRENLNQEVVHAGRSLVCITHEVVFNHVFLSCTLLLPRFV